MKRTSKPSIGTPGVPDRVRWTSVVSVFAAGTFFVALAVVADVRWRWQDLWPSVFLEIGAGIGLAGILFTLERTFVRAVGRMTTQVIDEKTGGLERKLTSQGVRIDELTSLIRDLRVQRQAREDQIMEALAHPSREGIAQALRVAGELGAIDRRFRVRASIDPVGYRAEFVVRDTGDDLDVRLWAPQADLPEVTMPWPDDLDVAAMLDVAIQHLERRMGGGLDLIDGQRMFENLHHDVGFAIGCWRGQGDVRLTSPLIECFGNDVALTTAGIECPPGELVVSARQIREATSVGGAARSGARIWHQAPVQVPVEAWAAVVAVATATYGV